MKRTFTRVQKACGVTVAMAFMASPEAASAQVSMGKFNTTYSQNFNGLPASGTATWNDGTYYLPGLTVKRTKTSNTITANNGSNNTGGLISYGPTGSSDRALGSISSSTAGEFAYGLLLHNIAGTSITSLDISYFGEQWRTSNSTAGEHKLVFSYAISSDPASFNLTPSNKNWTTVAELEFRGPKYKIAGSALDGNAPENKRFLSATLPVIIPDGHYIMLRWVDYDEVEADHGLAVDDVSLSWSISPSGPTILPVELVQFNAKKGRNSVELDWSTASEENNDHFAIERSKDGYTFEPIGQVEGKGNSHVLSYYTFTDNKPFTGTSYYRLQQVDTDKSYTCSKVVAVEMAKLADGVRVHPTITADYLQIELDELQSNGKVLVTDQKGRVVLEHQLEGMQSINKLDVRKLQSGIYVLRLLGEQGILNTSRFVKL